MEGDPNDPERLSAEERAREVAQILATGYMRLRTLSPPEASGEPVPAAPDPVPEALPESQKALDEGAPESAHGGGDEAKRPDSQRGEST